MVCRPDDALGRHRPQTRPVRGQRLDRHDPAAVAHPRHADRVGRRGNHAGDRRAVAVVIGRPAVVVDEVTARHQPHGQVRVVELDAGVDHGHDRRPLATLEIPRLLSAHQPLLHLFVPFRVRRYPVGADDAVGLDAGHVRQPRPPALRVGHRRCRHLDHADVQLVNALDQPPARQACQAIGKGVRRARPQGHHQADRGWRARHRQGTAAEARSRERVTSRLTARNGEGRISPTVLHRSPAHHPSLVPHGGPDGVARRWRGLRTRGESCTMAR